VIEVKLETKRLRYKLDFNNSEIIRPHVRDTNRLYNKVRSVNIILKNENPINFLEKTEIKTKATILIISSPTKIATMLVLIFINILIILKKFSISVNLKLAFV